MDFVPIVVATGLVISLVNAVKMLFAGQLDKVGTLLLTYAVGVLVAFLLANANVATGLEVYEGMTIERLDGASLVLFGVALAGTAGTVYDATRISTPTLGSRDEP